MLNFVVDSTDVMQEMSGVVPAGEYEVIICQAEEKLTKANDPMLSWTLEIIKGEFKGRKIFDSALLDHPNEVAKRIGVQKLNTLCLCLGMNNLRDANELLNKAVRCKVIIEKKEGYSDKNKVTIYKPYNESQSIHSKVLPDSAPQQPQNTPSFIKR